MASGQWVERDARQAGVLQELSVEERRAYAYGVIHAFGDAFTIATAVFEHGGDLHDATAELRARWEAVQSLLEAHGVPLTVEAVTR